MQDTPLAPTPISAEQQRRERLRRWMWWLVPKQFDLVTTLLSNMLNRLGLRDRTQAAIYAREHGLL